MSDIWDTKDGRRRVRRDPPTVEEAVQAAQGLTDELSEQIEIVASLMDVSSDEARGAVLRLGQRKDVNRFTIAGRAGSQRAVVVEAHHAAPAAHRIDRALKDARYHLPGSEITPLATRRCQMKSTTMAPITDVISPAP